MVSIQVKVQDSLHKEFLELRKKTHIDRHGLYSEAIKIGLQALKEKYLIVK